jgi:ankyrin repeat protein
MLLVVLAGGLLVSHLGWPSGRSKTLALFTDAKVRALAEAAARGDVKGVQRAVAEGASPNAVGEEGLTPLLYVLSTTRSYKGLRALLHAGADPNLFTADGMCPMVLAVRAENPEFLRLILEGGGNPNLKNASFEPVLQVAATDARWENVQQLLDHGADVNAVDGSGFNVLMNMVALRRYERIAWLIDRGADVHAKTPNGTTLARLVMNASVRPDSPSAPWREKVIQMMKDRGAQFPPEKTE